MIRLFIFILLYISSVQCDSQHLGGLKTCTLSLVVGGSASTYFHVCSIVLFVDPEDSNCVEGLKGTRHEDLMCARFLSIIF